MTVEEPSAKPGRLQRFRAAALAHLAVLVLIQIESFFLYVGRPSETARFVLSLPFIQVENLAVAAALGALAAFAPRWLAVALVTMSNAYAVLDQVAFKLYLDHFRPSWNESSAASARFFLDSFRAEAGWPVALNLVVAVASAIWLGRALGRATKPGKPRDALLVAGALGFVVVVSVAVRSQVAAFNLEHHALVTLLRDAISTPRVRPSSSEAAPLTSTSAPVLGTDATPASEAKALAAARLRLRAGRPRPPSIVLIVLESVGALQILADSPGGSLAGDGLPSAKTTPFLRELAGHGILLDSVYTSFPGTMRSHVALHMGGRTITYGNVEDELLYTSRAANLVAELHARGYATGCFYPADEHYESMDRFYGHLPFDRHVHLGTNDAALVGARRSSSWGMDESPFVEAAANWASKVGSERPFFLCFLTLSTHHPYSTPADWQGPFQGQDARDRYGNALHYTDGMARRLTAELAARGLMENTIVVVTGDHGEAFAERHPGNLIHNNRIYDENVRTFFLLADPRRPLGPVRSSRIGAFGDLMPTLLDLVDGSEADVPGQDLLSERYRLRTVYFHKTVFPALWGLRDGRWKFIEREQGDREPELFDLATDPDEQRNVAREHADMVATCHGRCLAWYLSANADFLDHLEGFALGRVSRPEDVTTPGPKVMGFGRKLDDGGFAAATEFNPQDDVVAFTQWTNDGDDHLVVYEWRSPSAVVSSRTVTHKPDWNRTFLRLDAPLPREVGTWRLTIRSGDRELISGEFRVDAATPRHP